MATSSPEGARTSPPGHLSVPDPGEKLAQSPKLSPVPPNPKMPPVLHPELELDRYRQTLIELASRHTFAVLLTVLASTYLALQLTRSASAILLISLAPSVIVAYVLRARLEKVSRELFDQHFERVASSGSPAHSPITKPVIAVHSPTSSIASSDSGYETGAGPANSPAMPAFVPHRLSPIPSVTSSQEVTDGHQTPSQRTPAAPTTVVEGLDYINSRPTSSIQAVENGDRRTIESRRESQDSMQSHIGSPGSSVRAVENGDISRRTTASGLSVRHPRLSTVPSNESMHFAERDEDSLRFAATRRNIISTPPLSRSANRDSTYTTTTDTSARAVENASIGRSPSASSRGTSMWAAENAGGLSRSTTATGAAVENAGGGGGAGVRSPKRTSAETGTSARAVEDWHASRETSGSTGTLASDAAVENVGRAGSAGSGSIVTHASTRAVEDGGRGGGARRGSSRRGQAFASFAVLSPGEGKHNGGVCASPAPWGEEAGADADAGRPAIETVNSGETVHTLGSTGAVEDDEDGSPSPSPPAPRDYARVGTPPPVLEGDDTEPTDGGDASSTESEGSAESGGTALRRRGGIRARRAPQRAFSQTTAATTMETHPDAHVRTAEWAKGHAHALVGEMQAAV